jgi:serine/threonine protein kinase
MAILTEGQVVRATYTVERYLGEGAFAEVYRVQHRFLGRQAMKVFKRRGMTLTEIEEILSEAVLLSRIGHPNIVRVFDANILETSQGLCGFFTMENVSGGSLDRFWRSFGSRLVPVETTVDILTQVCRGMSLAHSESPPIIHRDIKPQNILVGYEADGLRARVSDFGLAKSVNPLTLLATAAGTLSFKPPETFLKNKADSCAADVWALGVTLYLMLTDQLPFEVNPDLGWSNKKAFSRNPISPSSLNINVDENLERILFTCLKANPEERYQDAKELLQALESWKKPSKKREPISKKFISSEPSKKILGANSPVNSEEGAHLALMAIQKAKEEGKLFEAADMMEEAFNKSPSLRDKYANQVRLWRCGISM